MELAAFTIMRAHLEEWLTTSTDTASLKPGAVVRLWKTHLENRWWPMDLAEPGDELIALRMVK
jgi:hypothetical protein